MLPLIDLVGDRDVAANVRSSSRSAAPTALTTYIARAAAGEQRSHHRPRRRRAARAAEGAADLPAAVEDDAHRRLPRSDVRDRRPGVPAREPPAAQRGARASPQRRSSRSTRSDAAPRRHEPHRRQRAGRARSSPAVARHRRARRCWRPAWSAASRRARRRTRRARDDRAVTRPAFIALAATHRGADPGHPLHPDPALRASGQPAVPARAVPDLRRCSWSLGWVASLLVDPRTRLRRTGFEGPLARHPGGRARLDRREPRSRGSSSPPRSTRSSCSSSASCSSLYVIASVIRTARRHRLSREGACRGRSRRRALRDRRGPHRASTSSTISTASCRA